MSTPSEILAKWQEADQRLVDEYNDLGYRGIETAVDMTNRRLLCMAGALSVLLKHLSENESKEQR